MFFHQENLEDARVLVGGDGFCQLSHSIASFAKTIKQFEPYLTLSEKLLHGPLYDPMIVDWVSYDNVAVHLRLHRTGMQVDAVNPLESDIIRNLQTVRYEITIDFWAVLSAYQDSEKLRLAQSIAFDHIPKKYLTKVREFNFHCYLRISSGLQCKWCEQQHIRCELQ